jgi:L-aspartate oxidase
MCARYGIDITVDPIPVTPAAHYLMGGVSTDLHGRSSLPGLYAAGEVASNGVHGANRLASNSLLEGLVFGARAAEAIAADGHPEPPGQPSFDRREAPAGSFTSPRAELRRRNWEALGLERDGAAMREHLAFLDALRLRMPAAVDRVTAEDRNLLDVSWTMAVSALFREESRGAHYRTDFPHTDDGRFRGHTRVERRATALHPVEAPIPASATS